MRVRFLVALALVLVVSSLPRVIAAPLRSHARSHTPASAANLARTVALIQAPVPARDLYALTERLKLNGHTPIPRVVHQHSPNYPVGHTDTFWILDQNANRYFTAQATILCETPHLYLYVEKGINVDRRQACADASDFEHHIRPTDRHTFGSEWIPGVDDDPHITVFYGDIKFGGGYFAGEDEYPRIVDRYSNQREIDFINSNGVPLGASFRETLAHEFQHMIHWHMHREDEAWLNEGASMLAQVINGYTADGLDGEYAQTPGTQLDAWSDGSDVGAHYGAGFLWVDYLYERFGARFIHAMLADSRYTSFPLVADVLRRLGIHTSVHSIFRDWAVANYVNDQSVGGGRYGYRNSTIHQQPTGSFGSGSISYAGAVHPYAPLDFVFNGVTSARTIHFSGATTVPVVSAGNASPFWWSNRCDYCNTSMTRSLDLAKAKKPVLRFSTWYEIEQDYDYAYVEVSTDGGATWKTLRLPHTTSSNPNGDNFGVGFTGDSGKVHGNRAGWLSERVSLARYVGKRVLLRFEYVTDDEYNGQSWAIRDIAVSGTPFRDRVGGSGWALRGFVPVIQNTLPNTWTLQLMTYRGGHVTVHAVRVDSHGHATVTLSPQTTGSHAALVLYSEAAKTTLTSRFQLTG